MQYRRAPSTTDHISSGASVLREKGDHVRKLLSIIVLSCAMALAFGAYAPGARAGALTSGLLALKGDQANLVEKASYRCWWRNGYRHCGYRRGWRHHYGWRHRYWRNRYWRQGYYRRHHYPYRRHYYYNSYSRPYYGYSYRRPVYCIGLCWW